jgi:hypothetical protein
MQVMMTLNTGTSPAQQAKPQLPMKNLTAISTYRANELSSRGAKSSSMGVSLAKFSEVMKVKPKKESQVHLDMIEVEARVKMMLDQRLGTL